jgi:hypothetical protein
MTPVPVAGSIVLRPGSAIRAGFGVSRIPIATGFGWLAADFSLAVAIRNMACGSGSRSSAIAVPSCRVRRCMRAVRS